MKYRDQTYEFRGQLGMNSRCGLKIVRRNNAHIVIVTELYEENPGTSVTNFSVGLANRIVKDFGLDPDKLLFIEHSPARGSKLEHYHESFDIVRFGRDASGFTGPEWERVSRERVDAMISG